MFGLLASLLGGAEGGEVGFVLLALVDQGEGVVDGGDAFEGEADAFGAELLEAGGVDFLEKVEAGVELGGGDGGGEEGASVLKGGDDGLVGGDAVGFFLGEGVEGGFVGGDQVDDTLFELLGGGVDGALGEEVVLTGVFAAAVDFGFELAELGQVGAGGLVVAGCAVVEGECGVVLLGELDAGLESFVLGEDGGLFGGANGCEGHAAREGVRSSWAASWCRSWRVPLFTRCR